MEVVKDMFLIRNDGKIVKVLSIYPKLQDFIISEKGCSCDVYMYRNDCKHIYLVDKNVEDIDVNSVNQVLDLIKDRLNTAGLSFDIDRFEMNGDRFIKAIWLKGRWLDIKGIFKLVLDNVNFDVNILLV